MITRLLMHNSADNIPDRDINFRSGLNIVLAERAEESDEKGSRNGVGKSTLIEIIDFCLGGSYNRDDSLPVEALLGWTFALVMDIRGVEFVVSRSCDSPDKVLVKGYLKEYPVQHPLQMTSDGYVEYTIKQWQLFLGWALFGLNPCPPKSDLAAAVAPKYDSLIGHFVRKVFDNPLGANPGEWRSKAELAVTYLLGLDHYFLERATLLRRLKAQIEMKKSAAEQEAKELKGNIDTLKVECGQIKIQLEAQRKNLEQFKVNEQVLAFNEDIGELTDQYHEAANRCTSNIRKLKQAQRASKMKYLPFEAVAPIYEEAGGHFEKATVRHMGLVKEFHKKLQKNYGQLIGEQIAILEKKIEEDQKLMAEIDSRRAAIAAAQAAKTAFEEYNTLQDLLVQKERDLAVRENCVKRYDDSVEAEKEFAERREKLIQEAYDNHKKLESVWKAEELFFHNFIQRLYKIDDAVLGIKINDGSNFGISYAPHFKSDRSLGKRKLKTLGFDLTLFDHQRTSVGFIDFMVNDSVLFESSDSRQFAEALVFIDEFCARTKSQYITVLNSDDAQTKDFTSAIAYEDLKKKYVIHTLSDAGPEGTLLGVLF